MSERNDRTTRIENDVQKETKPNIRHLIKLWWYVFSSAKVMCLIFMCLTIALSLLRLVLAFIWSNYVDRANTYINGNSILPLISLAVAYYVINFISDLIFRYTDSYEDIERLDTVQKNRFQEMLETKMFKKVASIRTEHTDVPKINDTMSRVFGFTSSGWDGLSQSIMKPGYFIIAKLVSVLSIAGSLYIINPWLCLILIAAPIPTIYTTFVGNKLQFKFIKDNAKLQREIGYFQGLMLGGAVKEIKVLTLFDFFYDKWKTRVDEYTVKENKIYLKTAALGTVNHLISGLASVSANILAVILFTEGHISLGALGAVMTLIGTLLGDTSELFSSVATLLSKKNEAGMFFDLMDLPSDRTDGEKIQDVQEIRADDISYRYPLTDEYVLEHINLTIRRGEKVAFVGENGAGKTTFVKLISGLVQPSSGELFLNGMASEDINPKSRYDTFSTVTQEPAHYTTFTAADNVFFGDTQRERDEEAIHKAMLFSGLDNVDPDTLLGKDIGGTDISGGQWQKLSIARSYYRGRHLMILDEPTGNLDPLAEAEVFQKYLELAKDKTVIMVTHRISVASLADRIVVFANGAIVEDGTHEELMANDGDYARLYTTQAKWYDR